MFGFASFAELPFATIGVSVTPALEVLLGGHFGFDERDAEWAQTIYLALQDGTTTLRLPRVCTGTSMERW